MKDKLISIIVPVYNVENYIQMCIDSILNQTYQKIEIILVDDGSTDRSAEICDSYINNSIIRVFHKKNGGLSDARNYGIERASGEYLLFIDADDTVEPDIVEYLYRGIVESNSEISICPHNIIYSNKIVTNSIYNDAIFNRKDAIKHLLLDKGFSSSACAKLFKKELFSNIKFPTGKIYEDTATIYKLFLKSNKVSYFHIGKYNYFCRSNSIMTSKFKEEKLELISITDKMVSDILHEFPDLERYGIRKRMQARFNVLSQIVLSDYYSSDVTNKIINDIKKNKRIILCSALYTKKEKIATILLLISKRCFKLFWQIYTKVFK